MKDKIKDISIISYLSIKEMPFFLKLITIFCLCGIFFIAGSILPMGSYQLYYDKVTFSQFWTSGAGIIFFITGIVLFASGIGFIMKVKWARILFLSLLPIQIILMVILKLGQTKELFQMLISFLLVLLIFGLYLFRRKTVREYFNI